MHPQLYLGLISFNAQEQEAIAAFIASNAQDAHTDVDDGRLRHPLWRIVDYRQADALFVCGRSATLAQDNSLSFEAPTSAKDTPLAIRLTEMSQPCAMTERQALIDRGAHLVGSLPSIHIQDQSSLLSALQCFEALLRPLRSMYSLAAQLVTRRCELDEHHTYHLEDNGKLHAILDVPQRRILMRPTIRPVDVELDTWSPRPKSANYAPTDFFECSFDEVAWVFAMHSPQLNLPSRYGRKSLYFRRMPRVRPSMFYERHSALFELLHLHPLTQAELREMPRVDAQWIERDLFALYLCRSITTTPIKGVPSSLSLDAKPAEESAGRSCHDAISGLPQLSTLDRLSRSMSTLSMSLERV